MRLSTQAHVGIAALLAVQILTSVAGVALLGRMSPAVGDILEENVRSTEAVEEMLGVLATGGPAERFDDALERARNNITEPEESELLDDLAAHRARQDGVPGPAAVVTLRELGEVNRRSMVRADDEARELGLAGAWAMALLGFCGFLVSLVVFRRVELQLLRPVVEIDAVLEAARSGDGLRRCTLDASFPQEGRLAANLNWLLDRQLETRAPRVSEDPGLRGALLATLDAHDGPALAGDAAGRLVAANRVALAADGGAGAWTATARAIAGGEEPEGWSVRRDDSGAWVGEGPA